MSEISDAVQVIRIAFDGLEVCLKLGSASLETMQKAVSFLYGMLNYEKTMGKTGMKQLLMRGGDLQILQFQKSDMKKVTKLAKKYGILYSVLPDMDRKDGMCEVLFHSEAAPRVQMLVQKLKSARVTNMDDFLKNGNEEQLNKLLDFFEHQKKGNTDRHTERALDGLIEKVGQYAVEKQSVSVDAVRDNFQMEQREAEKVLSELHKIGVVEKQEAGQYKAVMDRMAFENRVRQYRELADRMKSIAASKNTDLMDITITKGLIAEENAHAVKTRIPGTWGADVRYIWINKSDIMEIHNGKTILTYLDKNKEYKLYSEDNRVIATMKGGLLYENHYDPVGQEVRRRYSKTKAEPARKAEQVKRR